jgi:hypothetical protein
MELLSQLQKKKASEHTPQSLLLKNSHHNVSHSSRNTIYIFIFKKFTWTKSNIPLIQVP